MRSAHQRNRTGKLFLILSTERPCDVYKLQRHNQISHNSFLYVNSWFDPDVHNRSTERLGLDFESFGLVESSRDEEIFNLSYIHLSLNYKN